MNNFDILFDKSCLPKVLKQAKTLSKKECMAIFEYMSEYRPVNILEFGVQYGCSTRAFLEMANWLEYKINLHSWDISDQVRCVDRRNFTFHIEDITGKEEAILKYKPDLLFLDAHPYFMTKKLMKICLREKINFMCHDVGLNVIDTTRQKSNSFKNLDIYAAWEGYLLSEIIDHSLLEKDFFEDDKVIVNCIRDRYGVAIIKHKRTS